MISIVWLRPVTHDCFCGIFMTKINEISHFEDKYPVIYVKMKVNKSK